MTRFGFLSTFPPTRCGLATFTAALAGAITADDAHEAVIVRVDDLVVAGPSVDTPRVHTRGILRPGDPESREQAVRILNDCDVVVVQHEYGIYGGHDGDEVLDVLSKITVPSVVVLHTVLASPTPHQRQVTHAIGELAGSVVAMTHAAAGLLFSEYGVPAEKVSLIPHGVDEWKPPVHVRTSPSPVVLTWGLIGPGKGIEWAIHAFALLDDLETLPIYRVLGQTHPKVLANEGERYRESLVALVDVLGLADRVQIDGRYQESADLAAEIAAADLVLLPYDSRDQTTSGVLVEAVAAGKTVIATRFPHAVELLSEGVGHLVTQERPDQMALAIRAALESGGPRRTVRRSAPGPDVPSWPVIANRYLALAAELSHLGVRR